MISLLRGFAILFLFTFNPLLIVRSLECESQINRSIGQSLFYGAVFFQSDFVDVVEESFVVVVDAEADVGSFMMAEVAVDVVLQLIDSGCQLAGVSLADACAPRVIPLSILRTGIVVVAGVVFLFVEIDVHQMAQRTLHEVQGESWMSGVPTKSFGTALCGMYISRGISLMVRRTCSVQDSTDASGNSVSGATAPL